MHDCCNVHSWRRTTCGLWADARDSDACAGAIYHSSPTPCPNTGCCRPRRLRPELEPVAPQQPGVEGNFSRNRNGWSRLASLLA